MPEVASMQELSVMYAKKQPQQVQYLIEEAPILAMFPWQQATHDLWNVYEELVDVVGAGFVDLDAALPTVKSDSRLKQVNLLKFGGTLKVGHDKAQLFGGANAYYSTKIPSILRRSGETAETSIIYDNLWQFAQDAHQNADLGNYDRLIDIGASGGYSIIAVKFVPGETIGLYSPKNFGQGALLMNMPLNGGLPHDIGGGIIGYATALMSFWGIQLAQPRNVAAMVNINADLSTNFPTETQMDELLNMVRASGVNPATGKSNTFLFMHPKVLTALYEYKGGTTGSSSKLRMVVADRNMGREIDAWNQVPIITSYNFLEGTEGAITVSAMTASMTVGAKAKSALKPKSKGGY
jgi:hypothetical protein